MAALGQRVSDDVVSVTLGHLEMRLAAEVTIILNKFELFIINLNRRVDIKRIVYS
jgi:hypothetical protein